MTQQEVRPELPDGYRISQMADDWFIPERYERHMWRPFSKGHDSYYSYKTWQKAYTFLQKKIAEKQIREKQS